MIFSDILILIAATLSALVAGLFFAWSISIMPGLARVSDSEFVSVMQAANRAIQNPLFFTAFFGAQIILPVCVFLFSGNTSRFWLLLAATIAYTVGVMGVTVFGNVPMNNTLDRFDLQSANRTEIAVIRKNYEGRWNRFNTVRTVASTLTVILVIIACLEKGK